MARQKKAAVLAGTIAAMISLAFATFWLFQGRSPTAIHYVCGQSKYVQVSTGMTKEEVLKLFGKPSRMHSNNGDSSFMGLGPNSGIQEAWVYLSWIWAGAIEIYFDGNGKVKSKNCGYG